MQQLEENFKDSLYSRNESVRKVAMIGIAIALVTTCPDRTMGKRKLDNLAGRFLVDTPVINNEITKYTEYLGHKLHKDSRLLSFVDVLGHDAYYPVNRIAMINEHFSVFRTAYAFIVSME